MNYRVQSIIEPALAPQEKMADEPVSPGVSVAKWHFIQPLIESMRPKQWPKNLVIFAGLIFSQHLLTWGYAVEVVVAFVVFCLLSSSVYLINDILDLEKDKAHPQKSQRPLPSGRLSVRLALSTAILLATGSIAVAFHISVSLGLVGVGYFLLFVLYSMILKNLVIVDVLIIASGFVLRAIAGVVVIQVEMSNWLIICTIFLALFLALCKRRYELVLLGENSGHHRVSLSEYSPYLLDQMVAVATASTVMSYALYTTGAETIARFGTRNLVLTIPFVIYGIFRYLYLVYKKNMGGNPETVLLKDRPMIVNLIFYVLTVLIILYT